MSTPLRRAVERRSTPILIYLRHLPSWLVFVATLGLVLAGLFGPAAIGAAILVVMAALIGWVTYLAWPVLTPGGRLGRLGAAALVVAAAVHRVVVG
ncbi:MAG: hypothetical protein V7637_6254 [Mycobacteriales bacterium]